MTNWCEEAFRKSHLAGLAVLLVVFASAAVCVAPSALAASWPQVGYSAAHTSFNPLETTLSPWNVGGLGVQSTCPTWPWDSARPVVSGNLLYFLGGAGPDNALHAMDWRTCRDAWSAPVGSFYWRSPVTVAGGTVTISLSSYALEPGNAKLPPSVVRTFDAATGTARWTAQLPEDVCCAPPTVAGGRVFVGSDSHVYALNAATGAQLWSRSSTAATTYPTYMSVANGLVYVDGGSGTVRAFQAATGQQLWTHFLGRTSAPPVVADGRVYVDAGALVALDAVTGKELWRFGAQAVNGISPPAAAYGRLYLARDGVAYALDAASGAELWRAALSTGAGSLSPPEAHSPAVANHVVYMASGSLLYAINAITGAPLWQGLVDDRRIDRWREERAIDDAPAVSGGAVFVRTGQSNPARISRLALPLVSP